MNIYLALILFYILPALYITGSAFYSDVFITHGNQKGFIRWFVFMVLCPGINLLFAAFLLLHPAGVRLSKLFKKKKRN